MREKSCDASSETRLSRLYGPGIRLDFVKDHQRLRGIYGCSRFDGDGVQEPLRPKATFEHPSKIFVVSEAHIGSVLKMTPAELPDELGLAHLAGSLHKQRLALSGVFPSHEFLHGIAVNGCSKRKRRYIEARRACP